MELGKGVGVFEGAWSMVIAMLHRLAIDMVSRNDYE